MSSEGKSREGKARDGAAIIVFAGLAANALTAFALQAWMTFGFAAKVWVIPAPLCVALIVALDVFAIMFMILTYLLRGSGWPRFVATCVFVFAIAAQVFAAEQYGNAENWTTPVRWFSALPAVFLAASQEGVILWRTHRTDRADKEQPAPAEREPARTLPSAKPREVNAAPIIDRPARADKPPASPPVSSGKTPKPPRIRGRRGRGVDPAEQERRDLIAASVLGGVEKKTAASSAGVSVRSVEFWIASYRERHPEPAPQDEQLVIAKPADQQEHPELTEEVTA